MFKRKALLLGVSLVLVLGLLGGGAAVMAQESDSPEYVAAYSKDGEVHWLVPGAEIEGIKVVTKAEFQEKFEMSPDAKAAIVHEVPPCPVVIDGIRYEPEQIHLFDGQRLGFTVGNDGGLYAFTTEEGMERFQQEQRKLQSGLETSESDSGIRDTLSYFYEHWYYGGDWVACAPGYGFATLGPLDNEISSFIANSAASKVRLFEDTWFQGDYFERPGGTSISVLWVFGWNDRASSVFAYD